MNRRNPFRLLAAAMGLAAAAPGIMPPAPSAASVAAPARQSDRNSPARPAPQSTASRLQRLNNMPTGSIVMVRSGGAVWHGRAKRGNRRHRSRWDYGR